MPKRECPAPKCDAVIDSTKFACRSHWYALPNDIRVAINAAFHSWIRDMNASTARSLDQAQARGIEFLKERYG